MKELRASIQYYEGLAGKMAKEPAYEKIVQETANIYAAHKYPVERRVIQTTIGRSVFEVIFYKEPVQSTPTISAAIRQNNIYASNIQSFLNKAQMILENPFLRYSVFNNYLQYNYRLKETEGIRYFECPVKIGIGQSLSVFVVNNEHAVSKVQIWRYKPVSVSDADEVWGNGRVLFSDLFGDKEVLEWTDTFVKLPTSMQQRRQISKNWITDNPPEELNYIDRNIEPAPPVAPEAPPPEEEDNLEDLMESDDEFLNNEGGPPVRKIHTNSRLITHTNANIATHLTGTS